MRIFKHILIFLFFAAWFSGFAQNKYIGWRPYYPARDGDTAIGVFIVNNGDGYAGFYAVRGSDTLRLYFDDNGKAVIRELDSLTIAGYNLYFLQSNSDTLFINNDTIVSAAGIINPWSRSGNYTILTNITDSVGIGDATPDYKLDVNGKGYFAQALEGGSTITATNRLSGNPVKTASKLEFGDQDTYFDEDPDDEVGIYPNTNIAQRWKQDSITFYADKMAWDSPVVGDGDYFLAWDNASNQIFAMDTTGWGGAGGSGGYWSYSGNSLYPDNTTDSVCVGTSTALAPLTVSGHISFSGEGVIRTPDNGGSPAANIYIHGGDGDPDGGVFLNIDEGDDIKGEVFLGKVDGDEDSDSLLVLGSNNAIGQTPKLFERTGNYIYQRTLTDSVGIGIDTPSSILHVNGNITLGDGNAVKPRITSEGFVGTFIEFGPADIEIQGTALTIDAPTTIEHNTVVEDNFEVDSITTFNGAVSFPIVTKTADYTAGDNDYTVLGNPSAASRITITLPAHDTGRILVIKNNLTSATDTVDVNNSLSVRQMRLLDGQGCTLQSTGSAWIIIGITTGY